MEALQRCNESKYECLLFDMDDTLYPLSLGLNLACRKNIEEFMLEHLEIEEDHVPRLCLELYREHGTTMAGLKAKRNPALIFNIIYALGYEFDNDEFHAYVHGRLPYNNLKPDPVLRNLLLSMPQRKIIFTNADEAHASQVLTRLGLEDCFEGVICFETLNPPPVENVVDEDKDTAAEYIRPSTILCKPALEAMEAAIEIANADPKKTIFFDDSPRNIVSGKAAGLHTVIVGSSTLVAGADHALSSIHNFKEALPELWEGEGIEQFEPTVQPPPVETQVLA
uniref:Uncharacterized protein n=1 Tax=Daucus carota subsp. sativus TaxID=79200 RepID=A0A161Y2Y6_DAUCS